MKKSKRNKGITLIALIITIVVLLILAGISMNAIVGDNGIQNANIKSGMMALEEFLREEYIQNCSDLESEENKIEGLIKKCPDYFYVPSRQGIGALNYVVDGEGHSLYLINKSGLPAEIQEALNGGEAGEGKYGDYQSLNDVYGVTRNLKVYYCSDGPDSIFGLEKEKLEFDDPDRVVMGEDSNLNSVVNDYDSNHDGKMSLKEMCSISKLILDSSNVSTVDFKDFYNFVNLSELVINDLNLSNLDGIENCNKLSDIRMTNCVIEDYSSIGKLEGKLKYLYFYSVDDNELEKIVNGLKDYDMTNLNYLAFTAFEKDTNNMTFWYGTNDVPQININGKVYEKKLTKIECLDQLSENTKKAVKYLTIGGNEITSCNGLQNFENLYLLRAEKNKINSIEELKNLKKLAYLMLDGNELTKLCDFVSQSDLITLCVCENENLTSLNGLQNCLKLKNLYCMKCNLTDNNFTKSNENALKSLENHSKLTEVRLTENTNLKLISYLKNSESSLKLLWVDGCTSLDSSDLGIIKEMLSKLESSKLKIPSQFGLAILTDNATVLDFSGQIITEEDLETLKKHTSLERLSLKNCTINDISKLIETLNCLTKMKYLNLNGLKELSSISFVDKMENLKELDIRGTKVTDLAVLETQTKAKKLSLGTLATDVEGTNLSSIPETVSGCKGDCYWNSNKNSVVGGIISTSTLLNTLNNTNITYLRIPDYRENKILDLSNCSKLEKFESRYVKNIKFPVSLKSLYVWNCQENDKITLHENTKLEYLYYHDSNYFDRLVDELVNKCDVIKEIYFGWGKNKGLLELSKFDNKSLEKITQNSLTGTLDSWNNFTLPSSVKEFTIKNNNNANINVDSGNFPDKIIKDNSSLESIIIYGIHFKNAKFIKDIPSLKNITLVGCMINDINFAENNNINSLNLSNNNITTLENFSKLKNCQNINLENNHILPNYGSGNSNLGVLAKLNSKNNEGGKLEKIYLKGNQDLTDFSVLKNLTWIEKTGF